MKRALEDAIRLLDILLEDRDSYFSGDYLNSEGRKLFEEAARSILKEAPFLKRRISRVRRKGDYNTILSLREDLLILMLEGGRDE
ncbi:MAG: hypothetical protein JHC12_00460 [Thermogladius sp.]|nr:hypothetical protein [Thermogladius sp.]